MVGPVDFKSMLKEHILVGAHGRGNCSCHSVQKAKAKGGKGERERRRFTIRTHYKATIIKTV
jgi:hypothetical protein